MGLALFAVGVDRNLCPLSRNEVLGALDGFGSRKGGIGRSMGKDVFAVYSGENTGIPQYSQGVLTNFAKEDMAVFFLQVVRKFQQ